RDAVQWPGGAGRCLSARTNRAPTYPRVTPKPMEIQHCGSKEAVPLANLFVKPPFLRARLKNLLPLLLAAPKQRGGGWRRGAARGGRFLTWSFLFFLIFRHAQKALLLTSAILWSHSCQSEPGGGVALEIARTNTNAIVSWPYPSRAFGL